jgi:hypothetical protein
MQGAVFDNALLFFFPLEKRVQAAEGRGGRGVAEHTTQFMSLINGKLDSKTKSQLKTVSCFSAEDGFMDAPLRRQGAIELVERSAAN